MFGNPCGSRSFYDGVHEPNGCFVHLDLRLLWWISHFVGSHKNGIPILVEFVEPALVKTMIVLAYVCTSDGGFPRIIPSQQALQEIVNSSNSPIVGKIIYDDEIVWEKGAGIAKSFWPLKMGCCWMYEIVGAETYEQLQLKMEKLNDLQRRLSSDQGNPSE